MSRSDVAGWGVGLVQNRPHDLNIFITTSHHFTMQSSHTILIPCSIYYQWNTITQLLNYSMTHRIHIYIYYDDRHVCIPWSWDFFWSLVLGCWLKTLQAFLNGVVMVFFQEVMDDAFVLYCMNVLCCRWVSQLSLWALFSFCCKW